MPTIQDYHQQLATDLKNVLSTPNPTQVDDPGDDQLTVLLLEKLIDAIPWYGNPDWQKDFRACFINAAAVSLPNSPIVKPPDVYQSAGWGSMHTSYTYTGSYGGYRDVFFPGIAPSGSASQLFSLLSSRSVIVKGPLSMGGFWPSLSLALVTDNIRQALGIGLNSGLLANDLVSFNAAIQNMLPVGYLAVYQTDFKATGSIVGSFAQFGTGADAANLLAKAIVDGRFTPNVNDIIQQGGDATSAATCFLFNLWITLKALDNGFDVDGCINSAIQAGLKVPAEIQAGNWWNGNYAGYFSNLSGADLQGVVNGGAISGGMPVNEAIAVSGGGGEGAGGSTTMSSSYANGYANSLCYWGALNYYHN